MIKCHNYFCLYQDNGKCASDSISVSELGDCISAMIVDIREEELRKRKKQMLKNLADPDYKLSKINLNRLNKS